MCDETHRVVLFIVTEGFADQKVEFDLIPASHIPHSTPDEDFSIVVEPNSDHTAAHEMGEM